MQAAPSWQRPHISLQSCPYVPAPHTAHTPTQHASVTMATRLLANLSKYTHTPSPHTAHKPQHVSVTVSVCLLANLSIRPCSAHCTHHYSTCLLQCPHVFLRRGCVAVYGQVMSGLRTHSPHTAHKSPKHVSATTSTRLLANLSIRHPKTTPPRTLHINHPSTCLLQPPHSSPTVLSIRLCPAHKTATTRVCYNVQTAPRNSPLTHTHPFVTFTIYCTYFDHSHDLL